MPFSPSSSVIADDAAAVVPKLGSENQMPGSSLDHGPESTPPLTIGISIDSPVRLSVMVMLSATVPATPPRSPRQYDFYERIVSPPDVPATKATRPATRNTATVHK